jgi:hypothetical protein
VRTEEQDGVPAIYRQALIYHYPISVACSVAPLSQLQSQAVGKLPPLEVLSLSSSVSSSIDLTSLETSYVSATALRAGELSQLP